MRKTVPAGKSSLPPPGPAAGRRSVEFSVAPLVQRSDGGVAGAGVKALERGERSELVHAEDRPCIQGAACARGSVQPVERPGHRRGRSGAVGSLKVVHRDDGGRQVEAEDRTESGGPAEARRPPQVPVRLDEPGERRRPLDRAVEVVHRGEGFVGADAEDRSSIVRAAFARRAVERAVRSEEELGRGRPAAVGEIVEPRECPRQGDSKHGSRAGPAARGRRAVEVSVGAEDEGRARRCAVGAREGVEREKRESAGAVGRQREDRSSPVRAAALLRSVQDSGRRDGQGAHRTAARRDERVDDFVGLRDSRTRGAQPEEQGHEDPVQGAPVHGACLSGGGPRGDGRSNWPIASRRTTSVFPQTANTLSRR